MTSEEESIEQAAIARRERLKALKEANELLSKPDDNPPQEEDNAEGAESEEEEIRVKFRNYLPHDKQLQENKLAPPVLPKFEDPASSAPAAPRDIAAVFFFFLLTSSEYYINEAILVSVIPLGLFDLTIFLDHEDMLDPFINIAPKKPNWDLRRDIQKKLDKLEKRTQKALYEIMSM
ncbi:Coiled-coil domain-containing protein 12 [Nymphaea thermarum]|nr:Coiled-coil domain-containing protein 12 [Nymphaea thermarum]